MERCIEQVCQEEASYSPKGMPHYSVIHLFKMKIIKNNENELHICEIDRL